MLAGGEFDATLAMVVTGVLLTALVRSNRAPTIFSDEAGTLGNSRWLAGGVLWAMEPNSSAANISYPLLLAPIFRLVDEPDVIYRLVMLANVALAVVMVGVLHRLVRCGLGVSRASALAGVACAVAFPAVAVQVGVAWVEITAMLGVAVLVLTAVLAASRLRPGLLVGHAATAGFLSCVHGRFVAVPILAVVGLIAVAVVRPAVRWWAAGSAAIALGLTVGLRHLEDLAQLARWGETKRLEVTVGGLLSVPPGSAVRSTSAQGWYLIAGSCGLVVAGLVVLGCALSARRARTTPDRGRLVRPGAQHPREAIAPAFQRGVDPGIGGPALVAYMCTVLGSIFAVSVVYMAGFLDSFPQLSRADHLYYGRYNECMTPSLIAIAVAGLLDPKWRRPGLIGLSVAALLGPVLLGLSLATRGSLPFRPSVNPYMVTALAPLFGLDAQNLATDRKFVLPAAILAAMVTVVLVFLGRARRWRWAVPALVFTLFVAAATSDIRRVSVGYQRAAEQVPAYLHLRALHPATVAYDPATVGVYAFYAMPFWLNASRFEPFDPAAGSWPAAGLFIGPPDWPAALARGLALLYVDPMSGKGFYAPEG